MKKKQSGERDEGGRQPPYRKKRSQSSGSTCFWVDLFSACMLKDTPLAALPASARNTSVVIFSWGGYFHLAARKDLDGGKTIFCFQLLGRGHAPV